MALDLTDPSHGRTLRESRRLRALGYLGEGTILGGALFYLLYGLSLGWGFEIWEVGLLFVFLFLVGQFVWIYWEESRHSLPPTSEEWTSVRQWRWTVLTGILIAVGLVAIALQYAGWSEWWYYNNIDMIGFFAMIFDLFLWALVIHGISNVPDEDTSQEQA